MTAQPTDVPGCRLSGLRRIIRFSINRNWSGCGRGHLLRNSVKGGASRHIADGARPRRREVPLPHRLTAIERTARAFGDDKGTGVVLEMVCAKK
jgi:hypothetical protein